MRRPIRRSPAAARPADARGSAMEASFDPGQPADPHPAEGGEGRLLPLRAVLLPALPARGAPRADGGHRHEPHRLPLRPPRHPSNRRRATPHEQRTFAPRHAAGRRRSHGCDRRRGVQMAQAQQRPARRPAATPAPAAGARAPAEHPGDLRRRYRLLEHQRLQPRHDGRSGRPTSTASPAKARSSPTSMRSNPAPPAAPPSSPGKARFRTGLLKVGLPGAKEGLSEKDPTLAELLKPQGYATASSARTTSATATSTCRRCTASTSSSATSTTSMQRRSRRTRTTRETRNSWRGSARAA